MAHAKLALLGLIATLLCSVGAGKDRSYVAGTYALILDGAPCGFFKNVEGGAISAEVIQEAVGPNYFAKKHIGAPKYEEFTVQMGFTLAQPVYDWIQQSWTMNSQRKNGSVVALDANLAPKSQREFLQALLTATTIPALDGSSKEPAYLTVSIKPEITRVMKPDGKMDFGGSARTEQKVFVPSNFRLEIDGIDCSKVNRIESFTVRQTAVQDDIGDARDHAKEPGKLEFPNLKLTVAEAGAQPFLDWHENFVVKGNNDDSQEKNGALTLLAINRQDVLARIRFFNLGIFRVQPDPGEAIAPQIRRVQVEMYVERMEFEYVPQGADSGSTGTKPGGPAPVPPRTPAAPKLRRG